MWHAPNQQPSESPAMSVQPWRRSRPAERSARQQHPSLPADKLRPSPSRMRGSATATYLSPVCCRASSPKAVVILPKRSCAMSAICYGSNMTHARHAHRMAKTCKNAVSDGHKSFVRRTIPSPQKGWRSRFARSCAYQTCHPAATALSAVVGYPAAHA